MKMRSRQAVPLAAALVSDHEATPRDVNTPTERLQSNCGSKLQRLAPVAGFSAYTASNGELR